MSRFALALLVLAALVGCAAPTDPTGNCATGWDRFVAALEGNPTPACTETAANAMPQSTGPASPCPASAGDACAACVAEACCTEASACGEETACGCLLGCRAGGATLASCSTSTTCNAPADDLYTAAEACITTHCAAQCPRLQ